MAEQKQQQHPITPPPELVQQWHDEAKKDPCGPINWIAVKAAQWGADQELEATLAEVSFLNCRALADRVRAARRPKPKSLKEQALQELDKVDILWATEEFGQDTLNSLDILRRALEALPDG
jgi:hypothetical protein